VAHGAEARLLPGAHEGLDMVPSVEGDAEGIGLEHPVNFAECRTNPTVAIVVMQGSDNQWNENLR
jgi:hypothetical protein